MTGIEYKMYVPEGSSPKFDSQTEEYVRGNLSIQASPSDDPGEFADEVQITRRRSRRGGHWVHGLLDMEPYAEYLDRAVNPRHYEIRGARRNVHGFRTDFTPRELEEFLKDRSQKLV